MLTKTDSMKKTTILITTQQIIKDNNAIGIYNMKNYLVLNVMQDFELHVHVLRIAFFNSLNDQPNKQVTLAIIILQPYQDHLLVGAKYLLYFNATTCLR